MPSRYRKIMCPDIEPDVYWTASNAETGEVVESADVAQLLKRIVHPLAFGTWILRQKQTYECTCGMAATGMAYGPMSLCPQHKLREEFHG